MQNTNGVTDFMKLLEITQQRWISQTERFRTKNALEVWNSIRVWEYVYFLRWSKSNLKTKIEWRTINTGQCAVVADLHH